jgi:nucleoside 2-deoxyribosyltransferase
MLEASTEVSAKRIVYDPQNPISPAPLDQIGAANAEVAYVLNGSEATKLGKTSNHEEAARNIVRDYGARAVVIKRGAWGAYVFDGQRGEQVPAYATDRVWPIGSGDVFAAVFAARWLTGIGLPAIEAAHEASRGAALYVNDRVLPLPAEQLGGSNGFPFKVIQNQARPLNSSEYHVYLAGPFFNIAQKWLVEEARLSLKGMGLRVFSPLHDVGLGDGDDVAPRDIEGLKASRCVLALVDGVDTGTVFEIGYARSLDKPVLALAESTPVEALKMISGTKCKMVSDFVTAIYKTAWIAQQ